MEYFLNKIDTYLDNHRSLDQHMNYLKGKLKSLKALKEDVESKLMAEALQPSKKPKKQVHVWWEHVERINGDAQDLEHRIAESWTFSRGFYMDNVLKMILEVENLLQQGQFHHSLVFDDPMRIGQPLSTTKLVGNAAENCMEEIWTCLMDDSIGKIGVWGMEGSGKTIVMKNINNRLLKETQKFHMVVWVTVSKEINIFKIQESISNAMGVTLPKDKEPRAGRLLEILTKKDKFVLILDDLRHQLSLVDVGIPQPPKGSKLVVTTRMLQVCRYLDCREVQMPTLPKQDAKSLFLEKVGGIVLEYENLLPIVESFVKQCAGLPLAIVTVASSMKGKRSIHEWRNALNELTRRVNGVAGLDEKVFQQPQFSYDHLQDERLQHSFLYCALYPEDYNIQEFDLIKLWIAEGLVEEMDSQQAEFDQGYAILNKLKSNCLLETGEDTECVKLHDLLRDMALRITRVRPRFLVKAGMQLKEIPCVQEWTEDLEKVSLMWNEGLKIPLEMSPPKCQRLTTLLLSHCNIENIPDCFFEQMKGLKVLDLSHNYIKELPTSISNLKALTVLLLTGCSYLEKVPSFSKLDVLKKLDLQGTEIQNLPNGIENLVNLDCIYVDVKEFPSGILSKFPRMRHLVVQKAFVKGEEIGELEKLEVFLGLFYDLNELNTFLQALHARRQQLSRYFIRLGAQHFDDNDVAYGKTINIVGCKISRNGVEFPYDVQDLSIDHITVDFPEEVALFSRLIPIPNGMFSLLEEISIHRCRNIKKLFSCSWVKRNLQNLEELSVRECEQLEEIIASEPESIEEDRTSSSISNALQLTLPKLRRLQLERLPELKSICSANWVMVANSVTEIMIQHCPKLQMKVFVSSSA